MRLRDKLVVLTACALTLGFLSPPVWAAATCSNPKLRQLREQVESRRAVAQNRLLTAADDLDGQRSLRNEAGIRTILADALITIDATIIGLEGGAALGSAVFGTEGVVTLKQIAAYSAIGIGVSTRTGITHSSMRSSTLPEVAPDAEAALSYKMSVAEIFQVFDKAHDRIVDLVTTESATHKSGSYDLTWQTVGYLNVQIEKAKALVAPNSLEARTYADLLGKIDFACSVTGETSRAPAVERAATLKKAWIKLGPIVISRKPSPQAARTAEMKRLEREEEE